MTLSKVVEPQGAGGGPWNADLNNTISEPNNAYKATAKEWLIDWVYLLFVEQIPDRPEKHSL